MADYQSLPRITAQARRLVDLGVPELLGQDPTQILNAASILEREVGSANAPALLVPTDVAGSYPDVMALISHLGRPGFVVEDFIDAGDFITVGGPDSTPVDLPDAPWYLVTDPRRGDEFENASPAEALKAICDQERVTLDMAEGIFWLLQNPSVLERGHCFMTIGSRKSKPKGGFDSRTPALWISNGTGRDGKERRDAPKLGWCWWNNRHTWLGIAHAQERTAGA